MPEPATGAITPRSPETVLRAAGIAAGVPTSGAVLIRDGVNTLYRLPGDIVARVGPPGSRDSAGRHVQTARWLAAAGIPVVRTVEDIEQPTVVEDRAVTWWVRLPEHRTLLFR